MKRVFGYLAKTKHFDIRYINKQPDYSHLPKQAHDWSRTVYGNVKEEIQKDIPKPLEKRVANTIFLDDNLLHDIVTGISVTAVLHFINTPPPPTDWYLKRQTEVETVTYGSEFVAANTAREQIMDLRTHTKVSRCTIMTNHTVTEQMISHIDNLFPRRCGRSFFSDVLERKLMYQRYTKVHWGSMLSQIISCRCLCLWYNRRYGVNDRSDKFII